VTLAAVPPDLLPAGALQPVRPAYGVGSLADLLPSVCAVLGVPGAVDVLGLGDRLAGVSRIGVLLVDGLGAHQVPVAAPYAPVLKDLAAAAAAAAVASGAAAVASGAAAVASGAVALTAGVAALTAGFPSTTPVSLATLGTGARPGEHGILGFTARRPDGRILNHVHWGDDPDPRAWQPLPTRFEAAAAAGVAVTAITRPEFESSGLTIAANRGAAFVGATTGDELAERLIAVLSAATGPALVYAYHPDLDKAGHESGVDSAAWRVAASGVDRLLDRVVHALPPGSALLVVADHGQLNVPPGDRYDMADIPALRQGVTGVAGEPRVRYLYVADGALDDVVSAWRAVLGASAWVLTRDEVIDGGWFGPVSPAHVDRIGDVAVICLDRVIALAGGWDPVAVGRLVAYHGSVTAAEMLVPLLIAR